MGGGGEHSVYDKWATWMHGGEVDIGVLLRPPPGHHDLLTLDRMKKIQYANLVPRPAAWSLSRRSGESLKESVYLILRIGIGSIKASEILKQQVVWVQLQHQHPPRGDGHLRGREGGREVEGGETGREGGRGSTGTLEKCYSTCDLEH